MRSLLVLALAAAPAAAAVKPHPLFSDHMVLQRDAEVPVWGTADPGEKVTVTLAGGEGAAVVAEATANDKGEWAAKLAKKPAGSGFTLTVKGSSTVTFQNVAVGDVWVCSGQSNMEWKLNQLPKDDQGKKVAAAAANPNIRLFTVPNRPSGKPEADFPVTATEGKWLECKPETVINFSAVGYFFGRDIEAAKKVPVGLIASDWGGTSCQSWCSRDVLTANGDLKYYVEQQDKAVENYDPAKADAAFQKARENWKAAADKAKADGKDPPRAPQKQGPPDRSPNPTTLFNGMIAPIVKFPITGVIWYQGESNAGRAAEYRTLFPTMIKDWRARWGTEFPFLAVQLAPFRGGPSGVDYAELRDAQVHAANTLPKVAVAVITDAGDETDIHPQQKEPVGKRLALAARAIAYGEQVEYRGPTYKGHAVSGKNLVVTFDHAPGGLVVKGDAPAGFAVAGEDGVFHPATAAVQGDMISLSSDKVAAPKHARFGWVNFAKPALNVFNKAGLPAVPFRTDDLPLTTAAKK